MKGVAATCVWLWVICTLRSSAEVVASADCPCRLSNSSLYPEMVKWDCSKLSLSEVPGGCFDIQSKEVAEFVMSYNKVTEIRSTSLAELTDLRELRLDNNDINFVDPTAFEFMHHLRLFDCNHNLQLALPQDVFAGLRELQEVSTIGTNQKSLPDVSASPALASLDIRSSHLTGLPKLAFLNANLTSSSFYLNTNGNDFTDVAASSLGNLPDDTILNMDLDTLIWAMSDEERAALVAKPWKGNVNLTAAARVCGEDGEPDDKAICASFW